MKNISRRSLALTIVGLSVVLFFAINITSEVWLRAVRLDLTQNSLYTLSPGTRAILSQIKEPITLRFYFSRDVAKNYATVRSYSGRVRDVLHEYVTASGGKLRLEEIDPEPFTPAEDDAVAQGLSGAPTAEGEVVYFGLVGSNTVDGRETIPFFSQDREPYLEYDLTSAIYRLAQPEKPTLGVIAGIPLVQGDPGIAGMLGGGDKPLVLYAQLRQNFSMLPMSMSIDHIPDYVSTLMVVHPAGLTPTTQYAIDQFVMRGGHAIVFVDPYSEIANYAPSGPTGQSLAVTSDLKPLLTAWGVSFDPNKVVANPERAIRVQVRSNPRNPVADFIAWLKLQDEDFNHNDPVTGNLHEVNLGSPGAIAPLKGATTGFVPLMQSTTDSGLLDAALVRAAQSPQDLQRAYVSSGMKYTLAARISGPAKSAFPNGAPKNDAAMPAGTVAAPLPTPVKESKGIDVIVVADSDIFDDRFWVQAQNVQGATMAVPTADNGALVQNAVENMMGSRDLISLRTRVADVRPFTKVAQLRRAAESQYATQEQQLQTQLQTTQARLKQLEGAGAQGAAPETLSPASQSEIEKFRRELLDTRAKLRQVQANLRKDVETLGDALAFLNIVLVPLLVAAAAIVLALLRRKRRAAARGLT